MNVDNPGEEKGNTKVHRVGKKSVEKKGDETKKKKIKRGEVFLDEGIRKVTPSGVVGKKDLNDEMW